MSILGAMKKQTAILAGFVIVKFALQYTLINNAYDLHRDEYLHLDQAKHLAWGYTSVPPVTSWISLLILQLGNGVFWVKFFPALFGALTLVTVWKTIEALKGNLFALVLGATTILFSVILRVNILYQPNSLDILCWTLLFYTLIRYIDSKQPKWLFSASVVFALGFLNKYNIIFLLLGLLPALVLTEHRKIFATRHFYYALLLALLMVSPNLLWQYTHNFPVFHHLSELTETQLVNVSTANFLKEQLLFFTGSFFVIAAAFAALVAYKPFRPYRLFIWAFFFTISLFIYFHAKGYYAIGLYPVFLAFGAVYLEQMLQGRRGYFLKPILISLPLIFFLPLVSVAFPILRPEKLKMKASFYKKLNLFRWTDGKDHALPQDFADMLGWKELAHKTVSAYASIPEKEATLIICDNHGEAGAINYYSTNKSIQAVSFSADYINWFPDIRNIRNIILVKSQPDTGVIKINEAAFFDTVYRFDKVSNPYAREYGTSIYILRNAKPGFNATLQSELDRRRTNR
jgi:hypothetical protein